MMYVILHFRWPLTDVNVRHVLWSCSDCSLVFCVYVAGDLWLWTGPLL